MRFYLKVVYAHAWRAQEAMIEALKVIPPVVLRECRYDGECLIDGGNRQCAGQGFGVEIATYGCAPDLYERVYRILREYEPIKVGPVSQEHD